MTDTETRKINRMPRLVQDELSFLLRTHLERVGDRVCKYKDGWNDDKIMLELKSIFPDMSRSHVANYRYDVYGSLSSDCSRKGRGRNFDEAYFRLSALERALSQVCVKLGEYELADQLAKAFATEE